MWDVLIHTISTDKNWSHSLSARFESLGYENIRKEIYYPAISQGLPMSEFWYLTWKEIQERLIEVGKLQPDVLEKAGKALLYGKVSDISPGMLTCIGQKPGK
ncbi:MAG: hypothetical protein LUD02_08865 [Tannerellaceae bacterium]|nr:hypothetical protein [Tannerellaceae bacterium]MCD8264243.1 hypothetical protein [Tannerellaceae bacterium]